MRLGSRKGSTLMEVLTAIAIVAIISGPLLYLFVTSARIGRHSYDLDKASTLSVDLIEKIKANPGNWTDKGYTSLARVDGHSTALHKYTKSYYYDINWSSEDVTENQAAFRADVSLEGSNETLSYGQIKINVTIIRIEDNSNISDYTTLIYLPD